MMTEYALQKIIATKQLIKSYEITEEEPYRPVIPAGREQAVITDTDLYNEIVEVYNKNKLHAKFTFNGTNVTWVIE